MRIGRLVSGLLAGSIDGDGGPFLFGAFSAADAMYAPVTSRFRTYGVRLADFGDDGTADSYCETIFSLDPFKEWSESGRAEMEERGTAY